MNQYRWVYQPYTPQSPRAAELAEEFHISPVYAALLLNRGLEMEEELQAFVQPTAETLSSPLLLTDMDKAADIIREAVQQQKNIVVYGDYDVDGITSTALLVQYLRGIGAKAGFYIPSRMEEGYGVNEQALRTLAEKKAQLIITVDCGITAMQECEIAHELGMQIIITDHHECREELPDADAVVNPKRFDNEFPFDRLAGVGVAYELIVALENGDHQKVLNRFADIVALGTIADVVSLQGENRAIVKAGLQKLQQTENIGLRALLEVAGLKGKPVTTANVGFGIAPRLNAAGRIGDAKCGVRLLLCQDMAQAKEMAMAMELANRQRQQMEQEILQQVTAQIEQDKAYQKKKVLVIAGEGWHQGVIGIVASRIKERYHKPTIIITCTEGMGKGSGRSIPHFNLFEALQNCGALLEQFGGHEQAAGITVKQENIPALEEQLNIYADAHLTAADMQPELRLEFEWQPECLTQQAVEELNRLEPCGTDNPAPCFSISGAKLRVKRKLSGDKHLKLLVEAGGVQLEAIGFGMGTAADGLLEGDVLSLAGSLSVHEWEGQRTLQCTLKDMKLQEEEHAGSIPGRSECGAVYQYIRGLCVDGRMREKSEVLHRKVSRAADVQIGRTMLQNCLDILEELELISCHRQDGLLVIQMKETKDTKGDIYKTKKMRELLKIV